MDSSSLVSLDQIFETLRGHYDVFAGFTSGASSSSSSSSSWLLRSRNSSTPSHQYEAPLTSPTAVRLKYSYAQWEIAMRCFQEGEIEQCMRHAALATLVDEKMMYISREVPVAHAIAHLAGQLRDKSIDAAIVYASPMAHQSGYRTAVTMECVREWTDIIDIVLAASFDDNDRFLGDDDHTDYARARAHSMWIARMFELRAHMKALMSRWADALADLDIALMIEPRWVGALFARGLMYSQLYNAERGHEKLAIDAYEQFIALAAPCHERLAQAYYWCAYQVLHETGSAAIGYDRMRHYCDKAVEGENRRLPFLEPVVMPAKEAVEVALEAHRLRLLRSKPSPSPVPVLTAEEQRQVEDSYLPAHLRSAAGKKATARQASSGGGAATATAVVVASSGSSSSSTTAKKKRKKR